MKPSKSRSLHLAFGARTFRASWPLTGLTLIAIVAFVSLGRWQWGKGNLREAQAIEFAHGTGQAEPLGTRRLEEVERFQRVSVTGELDPAHQFLLDNRTYDGRAGYEVLTPLERPGGGSAAGTTILVDRGWVPFSGYRDRLPDVSFPQTGAVEVVGRVDELPSEGLESGRAAPATMDAWPKVTSYPHAAELATALGRPIEKRILLLDGGQPNGYVRDWQPPGLGAIRHWSYAVQWWAFAVLAGALWLILGFRRAKA